MTPDPDFETMKACYLENGTRMAFAGIESAMLERGLVMPEELPGHKRGAVFQKELPEGRLIVEWWGNGIVFASLPRELVIRRDAHFWAFMCHARGVW
jgi:hypothetical protein